MFGSKPKKDKRFKLISEDTIGLTSFTVVQDMHTGVNYLITQGVNGLSTTILINQNGEPIITPVEKEA